MKCYKYVYIVMISKEYFQVKLYNYMYTACYPQSCMYPILYPYIHYIYTLQKVNGSAGHFWVFLQGSQVDGPC